MVCRQCGTLNPDGREKCFRCEHALTPARTAEEVRCRWHPETPRTADCIVCESPICDVCAIRMEDVAYCPDCAALPGNEPAVTQREKVLSPMEMATYRTAGPGWRFVSGVIDGLAVL